MNESDVKQITDSIADLVRESIYEQTKHKDREVSGLHREIRNDIKGLVDSVNAVKQTVDSHDIVINEIMDIYRTSSRITRAVLWVIVFVPGAAAFVAGILYLKNLIYPS